MGVSDKLCWVLNKIQFLVSETIMEHYKAIFTARKKAGEELWALVKGGCC